MRLIRLTKKGMTLVVAGQMMLAGTALAADPIPPVPFLPAALSVPGSLAPPPPPPSAPGVGSGGSGSGGGGFASAS